MKIRKNKQNVATGLEMPELYVLRDMSRLPKQTKSAQTALQNACVTDVALKALSIHADASGGVAITLNPWPVKPMDKARAHGARGCRFEFCNSHSRSQCLQTHIIRLYLKRPCRNSPTRQKLSMPQICILALEASTRVRNDDTGRHGQCVHMQYTTKSLAPTA